VQRLAETLLGSAMSIEQLDPPGTPGPPPAPPVVPPTPPRSGPDLREQPPVPGPAGFAGDPATVAGPAPYAGAPGEVLVEPAAPTTATPGWGSWLKATLFVGGGATLATAAVVLGPKVLAFLGGTAACGGNPACGLVFAAVAP
ncbi:MAG TPA: hypothetical protein VKG45_15280, partial [Actinomycetes bacterium]|nr:hypothetical protein [Actinomycetes bacterium]